MINLDLFYSNTQIFYKPGDEERTKLINAVLEKHQNIRNIFHG